MKVVIECESIIITEISSHLTQSSLSKAVCLL
jgi:hypothetical protein